MRTEVWPDGQGTSSPPSQGPGVDVVAADPSSPDPLHAQAHTPGPFSFPHPIPHPDGPAHSLAHTWAQALFALKSDGERDWTSPCLTVRIYNVGEIRKRLR